MKQIATRLLAAFLALALLCSCTAQGGETDGSSAGDADGASIAVTDANGDTVTLPAGTDSLRVVCLYGSYAQAWLSAGGTLCGVTEDAVTERKLDVGDAEIVGTVKEPNTEKIIALAPDWVVLSADIAAQNEVRDVLENAGLRCSFFRVDTFDDYAGLMEQFVKVTGQTERLDETVVPARQLIDDVKKATEGVSDAPSVLLIRAFSSGIKAKKEEELAGAILKELGTRNIADEHPSMLEDLSLEEVILSDPDFIFVTTMGSEKKALAYLDSLIEKNPAWQELTAVKEGRCIVLPKELFHYKPNELWGKSYEYLAQILYPDCFPD